MVIRKAIHEDYDEAVNTLEELEFIIHKQARPDYFKSPKNSYNKEEFEELRAHPTKYLLLQNRMDRK